MNRIEELRKEKGMSQQQLAQALNVHQTAVSQWETGKTVPSFELFDMMCGIFDVDLYYLTGKSDERRHFNLTDEDMESLGKAETEQLIFEEKKRKQVISETFDTLNEQGQLQAIEQVEVLSKMPKYKKE